MSGNRQIFITATDTGVGKTLISGLLLDYLLKRGIKTGYQKWAATGCAGTVSDLDRVLELAGMEPDSTLLDLRIPYRFDFPASPHLAAEKEGREIDPEVLIAAYQGLKGRCEVLLVEGVGGTLVPLRRDLLLADLVARLQIPTLLVARSGLGTLNHTLLSLEALRSREIPVSGVVLTDGQGEDETIAADNLQTITDLGRVMVFGRLPWCDGDIEMVEAFRPIGQKIEAAL